MKPLIKDPYNMIIIGVAGQGNVMTSLLVCNALVNEGYDVTFGQTYAPQQRGAPVINYIRVSKNGVHSPIIPQGDADVIVSMEAVEALRMLASYGNQNVSTVINPRMMDSIDIAMVKGEYPDLDKLLGDIKDLSGKTWVVNATEEASKLGNPIIANVMLVGVMVGTELVPLDQAAVERELRDRFPDDSAFATNLEAFKKGIELAQASA
jgi:indolepyruvate ferredoxin oxidoreductase, beta subunit